MRDTLYLDKRLSEIAGCFDTQKLRVELPDELFEFPCLLLESSSVTLFVVVMDSAEGLEEWVSSKSNCRVVIINLSPNYLNSASDYLELESLSQVPTYINSFVGAGYSDSIKKLQEKNTYFQALRSIPGLSVSKIAKITRHYPCLASLLEALESGGPPQLPEGVFQKLHKVFFSSEPFSPL